MTLMAEVAVLISPSPRLKLHESTFWNACEAAEIHNKNELTHLPREQKPDTECTCTNHTGAALYTLRL